MHFVKSAMLIAILLVLFPTTNSLAWEDVITLTAGGAAKEIQVNKSISKLMIACQDKPIIVNTVVMREGGKITPFTLGKQFNPQEIFVVELGGIHNVTGFRISDDLRGTYIIRVE